jgi:hypothetical protein
MYSKVKAKPMKKDVDVEGALEKFRFVPRDKTMDEARAVFDPMAAPF